MKIGSYQIADFDGVLRPLGLTAPGTMVGIQSGSPPVRYPVEWVICEWVISKAVLLCEALSGRRKKIA